MDDGALDLLSDARRARIPGHHRAAVVHLRESAGEPASRPRGEEPGHRTDPAPTRQLLASLSASVIAFATGGAFLSAVYYPHMFVIGGLLVAGRRVVRSRLAEERAPAPVAVETSTPRSLAFTEPARAALRKQGGTGMIQAPAAGVVEQDGKVNVLIVASSLWIGGAEAVIRHLAETLDRSRFNVTVCYLKERGDNRRRTRARRGRYRWLVGLAARRGKAGDRLSDVSQAAALIQARGRST